MISEALISNSTLTTLYLYSDEKRRKEIRRNNKEIKKREREKGMCVVWNNDNENDIYKWNK